MGQAAPIDAPYAGEKVICEYWAAWTGSNRWNTVAAGVPFGLGLFIFAPVHVLRAVEFVLGRSVRYVLTNRRIRVVQGVRKTTIQSVKLEDIEDVRLADPLTFTRTGGLDVIVKGQVALRMEGVQDPQPVSHTIKDAVESRQQIQKILADQSVA